MMQVGVHESYAGTNATTFSATVSKFPLSAMAREFIANPIKAQDLVSKMVSSCQPMWEQGKAAVWSFKPLPADVASGAWKPYVLALGQYIKDNRLENRVVIVIWHEPENDIPTWFKSGADFVKLFNTVHDWLMSVDDQIVTSHAALGYYYRNVTPSVAAQWVTRCTIHSIDIYSGQSFPLAMTLETSKAFTNWKISRPTGARWGVSERGWIADAEHSAERVEAIDAESDYLARLSPADQPEFYVVWNSIGTEKNPNIPLDDAAVAAVNRMFARLVQLQCPLCLGAGHVPPGKTYVVVQS